MHLWSITGQIRFVIEAYKPLNREGTTKQFSFFKTVCSAGDAERSAFWCLVSDVLSATELEAVLRDRLKKGLKSGRRAARGNGRLKCIRGNFSMPISTATPSNHILRRAKKFQLALSRRDFGFSREAAIYDCEHLICQAR
jgi:hypothetical protein